MKIRGDTAFLLILCAAVLGVVAGWFGGLAFGLWLDGI